MLREVQRPRLGLVLAEQRRADRPAPDLSVAVSTRSVSPSMRPSHQNRALRPCERQIAARAAIESTQQNSTSPSGCSGRQRSSDQGDDDVRIDLLDRLGRGVDLGVTDILPPVSLRGDVRRLDGVEVDELQPGDAQGGQLQGDLAADGADADDAAGQSGRYGSRGTRSACRGTGPRSSGSSRGIGHLRLPVKGSRPASAANAAARSSTG